MAFAHTPYDGSSQPFSIGLRPLDGRDWIEIDERLARDLDEKERLLAGRRDAVFREDLPSRAAQAELLDMLAVHLAGRFPAIYSRRDGRLAIAPAGRAVALDGPEPPLATAARLVQEDLCLMRRSAGGWRLAAGAVCFPSGWSAAEKFGRDLAAIHAPVPGFAGRMETLAARILDHLRAGAPLLRFNWSIHGDGELHHPRPESWAGLGADEDIAARAHVRIERQTLTRLPASHDILFTIRTHVDPLEGLAGHPRGRALARGLRAQLLALTEAQAAYKGLAGVRDRLARALQRIALGEPGRPRERR
jgi:hypothetical protein